MSPRSKYWCFTWNNYTEENVELVKSSTERDADYVVFGYETCPTTGTPHLQGYIEFRTRKKFETVRRLWNPSVHWEPRRATQEEAILYCKKEGNYFESGSKTQQRQGKRNDIQEAAQRILDGDDLKTVAEEHSAAFVKFHKGFAELQRQVKRKRWNREDEREVIVYWGKTGTGKTKAVYDYCDEHQEELYSHAEGMWFDSYEGQNVALFDEFSGSDMNIKQLLRLTDRYPMRVPIKGSFVEWAPKVIFITSNINPDDWYPNAHEEHKAAMRRRFTRVVHFNGL